MAPPLTATPAGRVLPIGHRPEGVAVDPLTRRVVVGLHSPDGLVILDVEGNVLSRIPVVGAPRHLALVAPGGPILAPLEQSNDLAIVQPPAGMVSALVPVGRQPHDATTAAGRIFVGNENGNTVSVIAADHVIATVAVPTQPGGLATCGDLVASLGVHARRLELIDGDTLEEVATAPVGVGPTHVVCDAGRLYVADTGGDQLLVLSATAPRLATLSSVDLAGAPLGLAVDHERHRLWITLTGRNQVVAYDITRAQPRELARYPTVRQPNTVGVDPVSGTVYIAGTDGFLELLSPT